MSDSIFEQAQVIFLDARALPQAQRDHFVTERCGQNSELREFVLLLLAGEDLASEVSQGAGRVTDAAREQLRGYSPGATVHSYTLLAKIGEGGFGEVWLAEKREPFVKQFAIKLIKPGMDSREVIARFEHERRALAMMDHPNIAKVLDGGLTPEGRPYFVMELVKGPQITAYADAKTLTLRERLQLFIPVCEAVQHAHQKGLIHRDLKPSNILIEEVDGRPLPKVIDFGIARAVSTDVAPATIMTSADQLVGTPEYMSPEQAEVGATDIDTRADVYSLGVVLYELLSGTLPFDAKTLRAAGFAEIQRIIREVDAPRPSTKLSTADDTTGAAIAQARQTNLEKIAGELRRELEWIPLKALRKDRTRRYASAEALGADARRYLEGKPLEAAPESRVYLMRKFARRNRVQVTAAGAVALALAAGMAATGMALNRALAAEGDLRTQLTETEKAKLAEQERAEQLQKVSDFQSRMLGQIDTTGAGIDLMKDIRERFVAALEKAGVPEADRTTRVEALRQELVRVNATDAAAAMIDRTILRPAIKTIDEEFKDDLKTDASLRQAVADVYYTIGLYPAALPLQQDALATRRRVLGEEHPQTLTSINGMGTLLHAQGELGAAEPYYREALEKCRRILGETHADTRTAIGNMGFLLHTQGKLDAAEPYYREALERNRRVLGDEHRDTLTSINNMGSLLEAQGKSDAAEPYYREAAEISRRLLGPEHPQTLGYINNLGAWLMAQGQLAAAEPYFLEVVEKRRRVLGEEHPDTLISINNLASLLRAQGRLDAAEPYARDAVEMSRRVLGEEHPQTLTAINNMGAMLRALGKLDAAEPYYREALEKRRRVLGEEHASTLTSVFLMASLRLDQNKAQEALDLLAPFEPAARTKFTGANAPRFAGFLATLARARLGVGFDAGRFALAESNLLEACPIYLAAKERGPSHRETLACMQAIVNLYSAWDAAEPGKGYDAKAAEWKAKLDAAKVEPANVPAQEKK